MSETVTALACNSCGRLMAATSIGDGWWEPFDRTPPVDDLEEWSCDWCLSDALAGFLESLP